MVRTPEEIRQSLLEILSDLRRSTQVNRDKISKLTEATGDGPEAKRLHDRLSKSVGILDKAIDDLESDGESDD